MKQPPPPDMAHAILYAPHVVDDMVRAYGEACFRAGMELAAQIASASSIKKQRLHQDIPYDSMSKDTQNLVHWAAQNIAAAIRSETPAHG